MNSSDSSFSTDLIQPVRQSFLAVQEQASNLSLASNSVCDAFLTVKKQAINVATVAQQKFEGITPAFPEETPLLRIEQSFDCSQGDFIEDICWIIYSNLGYRERKSLNYFLTSQHPTEKAVLAAAEQIFEVLTGDSPDYS